ncbi:MAG: InlB B-repeat-containing protein, partial [Kiritimatiellae bacterium]|nr:InlB B-repeat-containing protein [Kiritimatiellia bacterium]
TLEGPRFNLFHWQAAKPDFEWTPAKDIKVGESVSFTNKTGMESAQVLFFGEQEARPKGYKWEFSNGQAAVETQDAVTSFPAEALYRVYLQALGTLYTGPYRVGHWVSIGEPEEEPDKGENDKNDEKQDTGKQSCDPNELDGPMGIGEARLVKPGEWMDYTIYFENMAGFDIADAQDVRVANLLSGWLDWNTFEMREVAFNNQCDVGLDGLANGTSEIRMNGTDKFVQTTVRLDAADGIAEWYMRVYDPNGTFGWPNDGSGFLPSNDVTHRGEGHITYRIKVRDDAPGNVVITNTATIVFDYNDPIETDPAWWNTVAEMAHVSFSIDGVVTNLDIIAGQPYGELPEPAPRTGYTFAGWFTGANGTGERITASSIAQAGVTALYAYYSANTYAVRFNANGGACAESTRTVAYGTRIGTLPVATRDGYTFKGWGINADYIVTDDITLVAEWDEIIIPPPPPPTPKTEVWTVTFDANGGVCGEASRAVTNDCAIGVLPIATRECYTFAGWGVDAAYIVTSNITLVAAWNAYELYPDGDDPVGGEFGVATVWDAFVHDEASPVPAGTVQVKLAKAKTDKKSGLVTAKAAATVQLPGEKKVSLKGNAVVADDGTCTLSAANGANEMELVFCGRSVTGRYNSHRVQGARNIFTSKLAADKTLASNLARIVTGALNIAWSGGTITASFAAKGKVKIAGASVNGAKISVNTQAIAGESIVAIPVVVLKGVSLAANIYIASDGSELSIAGLDGARIGRAGELRDGLLFTTGATDETVTLTLKNGKPSVPKADKLKVVNGDLATIADNGNPIALKFTYTAKTGAFKGSFTLFEVAAGKLKKQAATFTGVFIEGIGYGTAVIKKLGLAWPVEVK